MIEEVKFLPEEQREKLLQALRIVNEVLSNTSCSDYEDYSVIKTSAYYLDRAVKYPEKYY